MEGLRIINIFKIFFQECDRNYPVAKLFQYQHWDRDSQNNQAILAPLQMLARSPQFFVKNLNRYHYTDQKTFNFALYGRNVPLRTKGLILVLLSRTLNISDRIDTNYSYIYILCSFNIVTHYFIVLFSDEESATNFYTSVKSHLDPQIRCPTDWLTSEIKSAVDVL